MLPRAGHRVAQKGGDHGVLLKKGDLIVKVDLEGIKEAGYDTVTPVIISNSNKFSKVEKKDGNVTAGEAVVLLYK